MFIKYLGIPEVTVQTREGPITVTTDEVIEVFNEDYDSLRQRAPLDWETVEIDVNNITPIPEATQIEANTGAIGGKFISPTTANPNNHNLFSGNFDAGDMISMYSVNDGDIVKVNPQTIANSHVVPVDSNTAYVNKAGSDTTGTVGDMSKPFLTIQAAATALTSFGTIRVFDGIYTENVTLLFGGTIILSNAQIVGNISSSISVGIIGESRGVDLAQQWRSAVIGDITTTRPFLSNIDRTNGQIIGTSINLCRFENVHINTTKIIFPTKTIFNDLAGESLFVNCTIITTAQFMTAAASVFVSNASNPIFRNCFIRCNGFATGLERRHGFKFQNGNTIVSTATLFTGSTAGSIVGTSAFDISHCDVTISTGRLIEYSGAFAITVNAIDTTLRCASAENITRTASPANRITLKSIANLSKSRDGGSGIINAVVQNDYTNASL